MLLSTLKPEFDKAGVKLVAIGCSREDALKFVESGHFKGEVYLDEHKVIHNALGCKVESWLGYIKPQVWISFVIAMMKGLEIKKTEGDYKQLGGTFVLDTGNPDQLFLFEHRQTRWGDHPSIRKVREAALNGIIRSKITATLMVYNADGWILKKMKHRQNKQNVTDWRLFVFGASLFIYFSYSYEKLRTYLPL
uniref:Uncharacterized protein n=1 Tax=Aplanochytrium stocchinoi TaxID=215587 RepID=A0A6S8CA09_9STRA|mmetsp:Transcript_13237/g.16479  ORF Transcript_13237/g.16479 Transcript_13237/m.16479 type:complete len:193 (+) Transcript_13237:487-1065(+)